MKISLISQGKFQVFSPNEAFAHVLVEGVKKRRATAASTMTVFPENVR